MSYTDAQARQQLLDTLAAAADQLGFAVAALVEAYELLDESAAERMEEKLFAPVQAAYGRAQRTHAGFADRSGLAAHVFQPQAMGGRPGSARSAIDRAVASAGAADRDLSVLQDSMLPVDVGDPELRAGLEDVRELVGDLPARARELVRTLGR